MMPFQISASAQQKFASFWLADTCTVTRVSGYGANTTSYTVATGVAYKFESDPKPVLGVIEGGFRSLVTIILKFAVGQDIRHGDKITDADTGRIFLINGKSERTHRLLDTYTATEWQDSS